MEDVVVPEEEEVVGVIEAFDVVHAALEDVPAPVKLVDGQRGRSSNTRLHADTHQPL